MGAGRGRGCGRVVEGGKAGGLLTAGGHLEGGEPGESSLTQIWAQGSPGRWGPSRSTDTQEEEASPAGLGDLGQETPLGRPDPTCRGVELRSPGRTGEHTGAGGRWNGLGGPWGDLRLRWGLVGLEACPCQGCMWRGGECGEPRVASGPQGEEDPPEEGAGGGAWNEDPRPEVPGAPALTGQRTPREPRSPKVWVQMGTMSAASLHTGEGRLCGLTAVPQIPWSASGSPAGKDPNGRK